MGEQVLLQHWTPELGRELYILENDRPVLHADHVSTAASSPATVDVLANDDDPEGWLNTSSVTVTSNPAHGTTSVLPDGRLIYTPDSGFTGTDTFSYIAADRQGLQALAAATVTITVTSPSPQTSQNQPRGGGGFLDALTLFTLVGLMLNFFACSLRRTKTH